jgi:hypothetical protein
MIMVAQSDSKVIRMGSLLIEANRYNNRTNYKGSSFLASNIHALGVRLFVKIDWFRWPEDGDREREIEVQYHFPVVGGYEVRWAWRHSAFCLGKRSSEA